MEIAIINIYVYSVGPNLLEINVLRGNSLVFSRKGISILNKSIACYFIIGFIENFVMNDNFGLRRMRTFDLDFSEPFDTYNSDRKTLNHPK